MTKKIVASIVLIVIALFVAWYAYKEYQQSQNVAESFIQNFQS
jgi:hypothetical protein